MMDAFMLKKAAGKPKTKVVDRRKWRRCSIGLGGGDLLSCTHMRIWYMYVKMTKVFVR
jgi:hypothetical protein